MSPAGIGPNQSLRFRDALRRLVRILLFECEHQAEGAVFEGCVNCGPSVSACDSPLEEACRFYSCCYSPGPKMTAFHESRLSGHGAPDTPAGGSALRRLKSRISRFLALVDLQPLHRSVRTIDSVYAFVIAHKGNSKVARARRGTRQCEGS